MAQCQWSQNSLCQIYRLKGTDTKPTCDGHHSACLASRGLKLEDIRDPRPTPGSNNNERSETMKQSISMSLAKKATITAKLDLATGATDYELKLTINTNPDDILRLIKVLQSDAPIMLDFTSPQMELGETREEAGIHA